MSEEKEISRIMQERTVEGFLDFLILALLSKNSPMGADDLLGFIHQKLKVSTSQGLLCSHLFYLEREGLIHGAETKNKKVYKVAPKGKEKITMARKQKNATQWVIDQILE